MNDTTNSIASTKRARTSYRPMLIALTASFLLGGAVIGYGTYRYLDAQGEAASDGERRDNVLLSGEAQPADLATASPTPTPRASATNAARQAAAVERVVDQQGGIDQRLAAAEQPLEQFAEVTVHGLERDQHALRIPRRSRESLWHRNHKTQARRTPRHVDGNRGY